MVVVYIVFGYKSSTGCSILTKFCT